jgi:cellulose biosynthesis protein BcsQ
MSARPFRVVTLVSNQGGVGKTTLAVNLAVQLRAQHPELPVLLIGLDGQDVIDRVFGAAGDPPDEDVASGLRRGDLSAAIRLGRHGVHYVPTSPGISALEPDLDGPDLLDAALLRSGWSGLVLIDPGSDLGALARSALWASDLALLPVTDWSGVLEAEKVLRLLEGWGRPRASARIVLSLVDPRIQYARAGHGDVLALLLARIRGRELPLLETVVSRSPLIEALNTHPAHPVAIAEHAPGSLVHAQLQHLAEDVLRALPGGGVPSAPCFERRAAPRRPWARRLVAFRASEPRLVELEARDLSRAGLGAAASAKLEPGERLHVALPRPDGRPFLVWAHVLRAASRSALGFEAPSEGDAALLEALARGAA